MRKNSLLKNKNAQVLGLPMYLIIIMIVAVAVIAAVIFMLPQGTQSMIAQVTENSVIEGNGDPGDITVTFTGVVKVEVRTNDERKDPIEGALVRLSGAHAIGEDRTDSDGIAEVALSTIELDAGINEAYLKMTVKATGYEDYNDDQAVIIYRG